MKGLRTFLLKVAVVALEKHRATKAAASAFTFGFLSANAVSISSVIASRLVCTTQRRQYINLGNKHLKHKD